jgi:hypothetical protein
LPKIFLFYYISMFKNTEHLTNTDYDQIKRNTIGPALAPYALSSDIAKNYQPIGKYALTSDLASFVTTSDLNTYVKTKDLSGYQPIGRYQAAGDYITSAQFSKIQLTPGLQGLDGKIGLTGPVGLTGQAGPIGPVGPAGPSSGAIVALNAKPLYFGGPGDTFHGVKYNSVVDGPRIFGNAGGALGYGGVDGPNVMSWSGKDSSFKGNVDASGFTINGKPFSTGASGQVGPTGASGAIGASGPTGAMGQVGLTGQVGPTGPTGAMGQVGLTGQVGPTGPTGAMGPPGQNTGVSGTIDYNKAVDFSLGGQIAPERGSVGAARALVRDGNSTLTINYADDFIGGVNVGAKGGFRVSGNVDASGFSINGKPFSTGAMGPVGVMGPVGLTGAIGPVGVMGPVGLTGAIGPVGVMGPVGLTGAIGPVGAMGAAGQVGLTGAVGAMGAAGQVGLTGAIGPVGASGVSFDYNKAVDFSLGSQTAPERGGVGAARALVRDGNSTLTINYADDFIGGVNVGAKGGFRVNGDISVSNGVFGGNINMTNKNAQLCIGPRWCIQAEGANGEYLVFRDKLTGTDSRYAMFQSRYVNL